MGKKWFFKRGNARVSWETLPEWVKFVTVDGDGMVFGRDTKPIRREVHWLGYNMGELIAHVGRDCPDWRDLIFERPQEPQKPVITAKEWRAIRRLLPGARWIVKEACGSVIAHDRRPWQINGDTMFLRWVSGGGDWMKIPVLWKRFQDIDAFESLVEYDGDA